MNALGTVFKLPYALRYDLSGSARDLPVYARPDHAALRLRPEHPARPAGQRGSAVLADTPLADVILETLLRSNRLLRERDSQRLSPGPLLTDTLGWQIDERGVERPVRQLPAGAEVLPVTPPWYWQAGVLGRVQTSLPPDVEAAFLQSPPVPPEEAGALAAALRARLGERLPAPRRVEVREIQPPYRARLKLDFRVVPTQRKHAYGPLPRPQPVGVAELLHVYGDQPLPFAAPRYEDGALIVLARDPAAERRAAHLVARSGLKKLSKLLPANQRLTYSADAGALGFENEGEWLSFVREAVPVLEEKGIAVEMSASFPYHLAEIEDWYGETEQGGGWFTLDLGVIVGGERLSLLPIWST